LSSKEQEEKEQEVLLGIDKLYEQQTQEVMRQWQGEDEESGDELDTDDGEMDISPPSEGSEAGSDLSEGSSDGSFDDAAEEESENEGEFGDERDADGQRIVAKDVVDSFRDIWEKGRERLLEATATFEKHGSENEPPVSSDEDESETDTGDSTSDMHAIES
jgi:hypothetical protein